MEEDIADISMHSYTFSVVSVCFGCVFGGICSVTPQPLVLCADRAFLGARDDFMAVGIL